jgi:hypothetical protein
MTENHDYETPEKGAADWHLPLNGNFERLDTDVEIRDTEENRQQYTPKAGAKFLATDTGAAYVGDGDAWTQVPATGDSPTFGSVTQTAPNGGSRTRTLHAVYESLDGEQFDFEASGLDEYATVEIELNLRDLQPFVGGNFRYAVNDGAEEDFLRGEDFTGHGTVLIRELAPWADESSGYSIQVQAPQFVEKPLNADRIEQPSGFDGVDSVRFFTVGSGKQLAGRITVTGVSVQPP